MFAVLALAYRAEWSIHYRDPAILDRVVAGLDYYMHAQGSDGGILATSPNVGWHGAPNRTTGLGSPLDGIGPYSLGQAVVLLYNDLESTGRLDELVDYNLDGKLIRRREGWWLMFNANIQGTFAVQEKRGGCPNQDLLQVEGLLLSNKACALLLPTTHAPLSDDDVRLMVNQTTGFAIQARFPENGLFFTDTGMAMECFGINGGGGLEFFYGANVIAILINLLQELDPIVYSDVYERTELAFNHYIRYIYSAYQENDQFSPLGSPQNPPLLRHPTTIDTRGDYQPDFILPANAMFAALYHAVTHKNGYALRMIHIQYMQNLWWSLPMNNDVMVPMLVLWNNFTELIHNAYNNRYFDTKTLPSELSVVLNSTDIIDTPDSAYVEIMAGGMNIKYGHERLLINMNYRHALNSVSGLAKVFHHGTNNSRVATIAFNSTDGFWGLWTLNYGNYFIAINRNKQSSYDFHALQYNAQSRYVLDIASGEQYDLQTMPSIPAWTAWVWTPVNDRIKNMTE
jgi:hypothetical protein